MSVKRESRYEVIEALRRTYLGAPRRVKGTLIAQAVELTGYSRQHVRRLLDDGPPRRDVRQRRPGRSRSYKHAVMETIAVAVEATGWICSKRLVAALPDLLPALEKEGAVTVTPSVRAQVLAVSASTINRRLAAEWRPRHARVRPVGVQSGQRAVGVVAQAHLHVGPAAPHFAVGRSACSRRWRSVAARRPRSR